jgi:hypothetical protein
MVRWNSTRPASAETPTGIVEEVFLHRSGLVGADVTVTLELHADVPSGAPENIVRIVTENCRTLKFSDQGFERE